MPHNVIPKPANDWCSSYDIRVIWCPIEALLRDNIPHAQEGYYLPGHHLKYYPRAFWDEQLHKVQFCGFRDMGQGEKCQLLWCFYDLRFDSITLLFFDSYLMKFWLVLVLEFKNREQQCKCGHCPPNSAIVQTLSINFHLERNKFSSYSPQRRFYLPLYLFTSLRVVIYSNTCTTSINSINPSFLFQ